MPRFPGAEWKGASLSNYTPYQMVHPVRGVIMHVIVGSLEACNSVFHNPNRLASAHFGLGKDGRIWQFVDTNDKAFAQGTGNRYWISIETEGFPSEPLTDQQINNFAKIYKWVHDSDGIPFQITDSTNGSGLGTHVMGGLAWGGHTCPGPGPRAMQRYKIIDIAKSLANPPTPIPPIKRKRPMYIGEIPGIPAFYACDFIQRRWLRTPHEVDVFKLFLTQYGFSTNVYRDPEVANQQLIGPEPSPT